MMTPEEFEQSVKQLCGSRLTGVRYYENPGGFSDWNANSEFDSVDQGLDLLCGIG